MADKNAPAIFSPRSDNLSNKMNNWEVVMHFAIRDAIRGHSLLRNSGLWPCKKMTVTFKHCNARYQYDNGKFPITFFKTSI